eukprot:823148-Pyramimonas_sp.AAC.2
MLFRSQPYGVGDPNDARAAPDRTIGISMSFGSLICWPVATLRLQLASFLACTKECLAAVADKKDEATGEAKEVRTLHK